jgi:hypothetical protein
MVMSAVARQGYITGNSSGSSQQLSINGAGDKSELRPHTRRVLLGDRRSAGHHPGFGHRACVVDGDLERQRACHA